MTFGTAEAVPIQSGLALKLTFSSELFSPGSGGEKIF